MPEETIANTPADPTLEFTDLKLGKKTYQLIYDFQAIARAERLTGMPMLAGVDWSNIGVERIRAMLFASALKAQPEIALDEFTPFIKPKYILRIEAALVKTWSASKGDDEEEETADPQEPAPAAAS